MQVQVKNKGWQTQWSHHGKISGWWQHIVSR